MSPQGPWHQTGRSLASSVPFSALPQQSLTAPAALTPAERPLGSGAGSSVTRTPSVSPLHFT